MKTILTPAEAARQIEQSNENHDAIAAAINASRGANSKRIIALLAENLIGKRVQCALRGGIVKNIQPIPGERIGINLELTNGITITLHSTRQLAEIKILDNPSE